MKASHPKVDFGVREWIEWLASPLLGKQKLHKNEKKGKPSGRVLNRNYNYLSLAKIVVTLLVFLVEQFSIVFYWGSSSQTETFWEHNSLILQVTSNSHDMPPAPKERVDQPLSINELNPATDRQYRLGLEGRITVVTVVWNTILRFYSEILAWNSKN